MPLDPRLEHYLSSLDRALSAIPVSDRADIVTEIKSHVLTAMDREPKPALDSVLAAIGEPEIVANHYLMERGLKPGKPPISPVVKWIVIGFLGTGAMMLVLVALVLHAVGPAVRISDKDDRVTLFGGLIDIDGKKGTVKIGDSFIDGGAPAEKFQGSAALAGGDKLSIKFGNGRVSTEMATGKELSWECKGQVGETATPVVKAQDGRKTLDLSEIDKLRCSMKIPRDVSVELHGDNGRVDLNQPRFDLDATIDNGRVSVTPDESAKYAYDFKVQNGRAESRPSDPNPQFHLHVRVDNGRISVKGKE